jgi:hypothetical protein
VSAGAGDNRGADFHLEQRCATQANTSSAAAIFRTEDTENTETEGEAKAKLAAGCAIASSHGCRYR